jgi:two-component sensor histidine kinase
MHVPALTIIHSGGAKYGWYRGSKRGYSCDMPVLLKQKLHARAESVPDARRAVQRALVDAGLVDADLQEAVALTVTEATSNVVRHAYPRNGSGDLEITVRTNRAWLEIGVDDDGIGFQTPDVSHPGAGLGLRLMRHYARQLSVESGDRGTLVTMRFRLPGGATR